MTNSEVSIEGHTKVSMFKIFMIPKFKGSFAKGMPDIPGDAPQVYMCIIYVMLWKLKPSQMKSARWVTGIPSCRTVFVCMTQLGKRSTVPVVVHPHKCYLGSWFLLNCCWPLTVTVIVTSPPIKPGFWRGGSENVAYNFWWFSGGGGGGQKM